MGCLDGGLGAQEIFGIGDEMEFRHTRKPVTALHIACIRFETFKTYYIWPIRKIEYRPSIFWPQNSGTH